MDIKYKELKKSSLSRRRKYFEGSLNEDRAGPYERLACAVFYQAIIDYEILPDKGRLKLKKGVYETKEDIKRWLLDASDESIFSGILQTGDCNEQSIGKALVKMLEG